MFETIGKIFNSKKMIDAVVDSGDALIFTDEERAKMKLDMLKNFEPFKLAQRLLALIFTVNFIVAFWVGVAFYKYDPNHFSGFIKIVDSFQIGWIALAIVSFYFTGGVIGSFKGMKK